MFAPARISQHDAGRAVRGPTRQNCWRCAIDGAFIRTFGDAGADQLTLLFTNMHYNGYRLNAVFFGPWLVPLGYLMIKSGYFPKLLGVLPIVACVGYFGLFATTFVFPASEGTRVLLTTVAGVCEIVAMLWLLVVGARVPSRVGDGTYS